MDWSDGHIILRSGRWGRRVEAFEQQDTLELFDPNSPGNKMRIPLPFSWRQLPDSHIQELARDPEVRLWSDEYGIPWRIAMVGPGTRYEYPLQRRYLVFDSAQAWAGIVEPPEGLLIGDLKNDELKELRDRISDIGGRRRRFRKPERLSPTG